MQSFHGVKTRGGSQTELICGRRTARLLSVNAGTRHISHSKQSQSRNTGLVDAGRLLSLGTGGDGQRRLCCLQKGVAVRIFSQACPKLFSCSLWDKQPFFFSFFFGSNILILMNLAIFQRLRLNDPSDLRASYIGL